MKSRNDAVQISGAPGSPYTRKMLAVLRYRRIPYHFLSRLRVASLGLPAAKVPLLPTFYYPDENGALQPVTDSSPLIRRLERDWSGRSLVPADPALALVDMLLEDYADEWLTKAMFHYRWAFAPDIERSSKVLPYWRGLSQPDEVIAKLSRAFAARQISRLPVVGSNETTGPVIEASYGRFLDLLNAHLREHPYLMGARPGAGDFAVFGQLTQLVQFDPTPMAVALERAPRVYAWVSQMEDLSGEDPQPGDWFDVQALPDTLLAILSEMARVYSPVMLANARAIAADELEVRAEVDGQPWVQQPFPYQAKCLRWLREARAGLDEAALARVDPVLQRTSLITLFD
ncbi:MAG: glutathione S-transferase family protein [Burkholderiaceae bacterium]